MTTKDMRPSGANMKKFCIAAAILVLTASNLKAQLNAYFINVGQGDAVYLVTKK